jgi:hypothetical protein
MRLRMMVGAVRGRRSLIASHLAESRSPSLRNSGTDSGRSGVIVTMRIPCVSAGRELDAAPGTKGDSSQTVRKRSGEQTHAQEDAMGYVFARS